MLKILLIGLKNGANMGDVLINECTEYLIKSVFEELSFSDYSIFSIDMETDNYEIVNLVDLIIFTGGGIIKYKYQKFYLYINAIIDMALKRNTPVIFNAVGVEGYDENDERCVLLKQAINAPCVKQITVRDDIELLRRSYLINNNIHCEKVADSATWTYEVYKIKKKRDSNKIGLGVIREGIFRSNDIDLGLEELLKFWGDVIAALEENNVEWEIFTTGWPSDMKFAHNLIKHIGREGEMGTRISMQPKNAANLVHTISNYKGIIAGRLHANIVAYSLDIPSVGIVWNEKCAFWGDNIGCSDRFVRHHELEGKLLVNKLNLAMNYEYLYENKYNYKKTIYTSLRKYLSKIINQYTNGEIKG